MKHLFVVNPIAGGKRNNHEKTVQSIRDAMAKNGGDYEIYITKAHNDAINKVRSEAETGKILRVYACGGDGTFHECVNGCVGYDNASVTVYPCGTGNDFIKIFGEEKELFFDIDKLINGFSHPIDVIHCNGRYSVNICSMGFDARIGADVHKYDKIPFVKGMGAYVVSLIVNFFKGINQYITIKIGDNIQSGEYAVICACNGRYYGGGFNPLKDARPDDGVLDTVIIKKCTRLNFLRLIKKYATGRYTEAGEIVERVSDDCITIESDEEMVVSLDGEVLKDRCINLQLIHNGVVLLCPNGMKFFGTEKEFASITK